MDKLIIALLALTALIAAAGLAVGIRALKAQRRLEMRLESAVSEIKSAIDGANEGLKTDISRQKHLISEGLFSLNESFTRSVINSAKK